VVSYIGLGAKNSTIAKINTIIMQTQIGGVKINHTIYAKI
jgi:hypothetical protein